MAKKKSYATRTDLRAPLIICAIIGALLLTMFLVVTFVEESLAEIRYLGILLLGAYIVAVSILLTSYLVRYHRVRSADDMAELLKKTLTDKGYTLFKNSPTNQQFIVLENEKMQALSQFVDFSFWEKLDENHTVVRFATSWATKKEDIDKLAALL